MSEYPSESSLVPEPDWMQIEWDMPIAMDDGVTLRADVFRPADEDRHPVILSYGPYAKGLSFQVAYAPQWEKMVSEHRDVLRGSSNRYQNWEVVDPEKWVPDGYVCVRVDSRGAGRSPGLLDLWSPRETQDFHDCIEWAGTQPWSNGKVGLLGISYYAMNQYQVATSNPKHLAAICPWEGASDWYREMGYHGGILCQFARRWFPLQVSTVQHGLGDRGQFSLVTGEAVAGPETLSADELSRNRRDFAQEIADRPLFDSWYESHNPDWQKVRVPMLSAANWGGQGLHPRGNFEAFTQAATRQKWLEVHGNEHWTHFYTDYGIRLQKRFFDHFLKGVSNGWIDLPRVHLNIRHVNGEFSERDENEWPLARTKWTKLYLEAGGKTLSNAPGSPAEIPYAGKGTGVTFTTPPVAADTEMTGPVAAKLFISSAGRDADLFLIVRVFDPDGEEVTFQGALDPNTPIAQGWLRASHRKLDGKRSLPYRPYHTHDEVQPLKPGQVYELDIEIWPTCVVVPSGYRIALTVQGKDYQYEGELSDFAKTFHYAHRGIGPFQHEDPTDRPDEIFGADVTIYTGGDRASYLMLPIIP
jgi:predicted acyl esterase